MELEDEHKSEEISFESTEPEKVDFETDDLAFAQDAEPVFEPTDDDAFDLLDDDGADLLDVAE